LRYENRLKRLESKTDTQDYPEVIEWIRQGRYYNELTYEEKLLYQEYCEFGDSSMAKAAIEVENVIFEDDDEPPNFKLEFRKRRKEPTPEEFAEIVKEVERMVESCQEEHNS
jgi:hypothetical protein